MTPNSDLQQALLDSLDEATLLLRRFRVDNWADWLDSDKRRLARGDMSAFDHLLSAFGGMGSLNDVVLYEVESQLPRESSHDAQATEQLRACQERIWQLARALQRDLT